MVFMAVLLLWEHRVIQRIKRHIVAWFILIGNEEEPVLTEGARRERADVLDKLAQIKAKRS